MHIDTNGAWVVRLYHRFGLLVNWFVPASTTRGRTQLELVRIFVFTHLFGPILAQPMVVCLYFLSPSVDFSLTVVAFATWSFWSLPIVLRYTGSIRLVSLISFQILAAVSLFGAYFYGGFSSPFLPWLSVSLLLGLFYLSKDANIVMMLFALDVAVFLLAILFFENPSQVSVDKLTALSWMSIGSATIYMTWMALYYARIIGLKSELEAEIIRQHATSLDLQHARDVAEKNEQTRSQFFSKMSHELRTPLNAIIGYSDILLEEYGDRSVDINDRATDISRINAAGRHLLSLVSHVLDADKLKDSSANLSITEFTLGELCDDLVASALPGVEAGRNRLVVVCPDREGCLHTDATKLRQILLNLLSNAGKFTAEGVVKLELYLVRHSLEIQLHAVVSDTGVGISPEFLQRLFTEYEQADASTFSNFGGTGLGLALSRKLSILLGGDILVSSCLHYGSTFTVNIPTHLSEESLGLAADGAEDHPTRSSDADNTASHSGDMLWPSSRITQKTTALN